MKCKSFILLLTLFSSHNIFCQEVGNPSGYRCTATIAGIKDKGTLSIDSLCVPVLEGCDSNCKIVYFELTITVAGVGKTYATMGRYFTPEMQVEISKVNPGTKIIFDKIKYSVPNEQVRTIMHPIIITVR